MRRHLKKGMSVLDVGSWKKDSYRTFKEFVPENYTGIDIKDGPNVDIVVDPYEWPFEDESFDIVISGNSFEHMERFWDVFVEMVRVLKEGGYICVLAPYKTAHIHRFPIDCWRFLPDGMKVLADVGKVKLIKSCKKNYLTVGIYQK